MGIFSEIDVELREMIATGGTRKQIANRFPFLREDEIDSYFLTNVGDEYTEEYIDNEPNMPWLDPSMYGDFQDLLYGDYESDHGQLDEIY